MYKMKTFSAHETQKHITDGMAGMADAINSNLVN